MIKCHRFTNKDIKTPCEAYAVKAYVDSRKKVIGNKLCKVILGSWHYACPFWLYQADIAINTTSSCLIVYHAIVI